MKRQLLWIAHQEIEPRRQTIHSMHEYHKMDRRLVGQAHPTGIGRSNCGRSARGITRCIMWKNVAAEIDVLPSNDTALRRWRMI